jgi:hypothetical protein
MRILPLIFLLSISITSYAQTTEDCDLKCRSQLLRVTIAPDALKNIDLSPAAPLIDNVLASDHFKKLISGPFDLPSLAFPHDRDKCLEEKSEGNANFASIDCNSSRLCDQKDLNPSVRRKICFQLACPVVAGDNRDQCSDDAEIPFTSIDFPDPLKINDFSFSVSKKVEIKDGVLQGCLKINRLSVEVGTRMNFDPQGTSIQDSSILIQNVKPSFDESSTPREVCYRGNVNLGSPTPLQGLSIEVQGSEPFISNEMIVSASKDLKISGLSGYSSETVQDLQGEAYRLFHPVREPVEEGIRTALAEVLEETLSETLVEYSQTSKSKEKSSYIDGRSFMSELSFHNSEASRLYKELECSQLFFDNTYRLEFDEFNNHPSMAHCRGDESIRISPRESDRRQKLDALAQFVETNSITSESLRRKLVNSRDMFVNEYAYHTYPQFKPANFDSDHRQKMEKFYDEKIRPIIAKIEENQTARDLPLLIGKVLNDLNPQTGLEFGASLPELCNSLGSSPLANRRMKNCPIQVYADLNQFNELLNKFWQNGQICQEGSGAECKYVMGDVTCILGKAPSLKSVNSRFEITIPMQNCSRSAFLGGFNGKMDFKLSFIPKACHNGDLCLDDPIPDVILTESSVGGALRKKENGGLGFRDMVLDRMKGAILGAATSFTRIPFASAVSGPLAQIPLRAQGQVDAGNGFFGVCLEPDNNKGQTGGSRQ